MKSITWISGHLYLSLEIISVTLLKNIQLIVPTTFGNIFWSKYCSRDNAYLSWKLLTCEWFQALNCGGYKSINKNSQQSFKRKKGHSSMLNQKSFQMFSSLTSFKTKVVECINLLLPATLINWQGSEEEKSNALLNWDFQYFQK